MWLASPPPVKDPVSTTGCGDAATAGWMYAMANECGPEDTVRRAVSAGTAKLQNEDPGCLDGGEVDRLNKVVRVMKLE